MWSRDVEEHQRRCAVVGPPIGWRVVCHVCAIKFPIMPGAPGTGGASVLKCCAQPRHRIHDLRILCPLCAGE